MKKLMVVVLLCFSLVAAQAAQVRIKSVSSNYSATKYDDVILVDASGGARTVTLPAASAAIGSAITVKKTDSSANAVVVSGGSIDGYGASYSMTVQNASVQLASDGSKYQVIAVESGAHSKSISFAKSTSEITACDTSPCTIHRQSGAWVTSVTRSGTGVYVVNIAAGVFLTPPTCTALNRTNSFRRIYSYVATTTSALTIQTEDNSGAAADSALDIICQ